MLPLIYVETNWLAALAFRHDRYYGDAMQLLEDAMAGRCELRIPYPAVLEARHSAPRRSRELNKAIVDLEAMLGHAARNGQDGFTGVIRALERPTLERYLRRVVDVEAVLQEHRLSPLPFDPASLTVMDELRSTGRHRAPDAADLAILAAIIHDRRKYSIERPAVLFSTNTADFDPKGSKIPADLFVREGIVFDSSFKLSTAVGRWRAEARRR